MKAQERRELPAWAIATVLTVVIFAVVGLLVWGIVVLVDALTGPPGPGDVSVSWQCTEFGDRLYWPTGYSSRGFAVVPGGCR